MLVAYSIDFTPQLNRWFIMRGHPKEQFEERVDFRHPQGFATQKEAEAALIKILGVINNLPEATFTISDTIL